MKEILRKALVVVEYYIRHWWKYRFNAITWDFIVPITEVITAYFTGIFVQKVNFYNSIIPYFQFILFSTPFIWMFFGTIWSIGWAFIRSGKEAEEEFVRILYSGTGGYILYSVLWEFYLNGFRGILMLAIGYVLFRFPLYYFLLLIFLLFLTEFFAMSMSFFFSSIAMVLRREAESIFNNVDWLLGLVISSHFSILIFPENIREIILFFVPFAWFLEIIRKYFIFQTISFYDISILAKSFVINVIYFLLGLFIFIKTFDWARKKGKVRLI